MATSPSPPPPTEPAIAVYPIIDIIVRIIPDNMLGKASLKYTCTIICISLAPNDLAASINPESTERRADSITRATKGIALIVKGTIAAVDHNEVPTMALVTGMTRINRMINGKDRNVFTIKSST